MWPKNQQKKLKILKGRLEEIIDLEHPLIVLSKTIKWK